MKSKLQRLREIQAKMEAMAFGIDVNCEESEKQFNEINGAATELAEIINDMENGQFSLYIN